ncbi:MAG: choice-of-anchor D domain-containing protein [Deltaproteobacteria bacterium]
MNHNKVKNGLLLVFIGLVIFVPVFTQAADYLYQYSAKWGSQGAAAGQFQSPSGIAIDSTGTVYVSDTSNNRIQKFTSSGTNVGSWGSVGMADGQLKRPWGIAIGSDDNLYVADSNNCRIQKFTPAGAFVAKFGSWGSSDGQFMIPAGVAVSPDGMVYVADMLNNRIQRFTAGGAFSLKWGSSGTGDGQFNSPNGITVDSSNNVYVVDSGNNRIQKFASNGTFVAKWGTNGIDDGQFTYPMGVAVDPSGNVFVTDAMGRVQKFTSEGTFITKTGALGTGDGQMKLPGAVALDTSGNIYATDTDNHRIQKFAAVQAYSISGRVLDFADFVNVIQNATVTILDESANAVATPQTDKTGSFTATLAQKGDYTISASKLGYEMKSTPQFAAVSDTARTATGIVIYLKSTGQLSDVSFNLSTGWNFVATTKQPWDQSIAKVLSDISSKVRIVWGYNNQTQVWSRWKPASLNNTLATIESGKGYWIYVNEPVTLTITGTIPSSTLHLFEGWNLIGYMGQDNASIASELQSFSGKWSIVWHWDNSIWYAKDEVQTNLPVQALTYFRRGKAYWVSIKSGTGGVYYNPSLPKISLNPDLISYGSVAVNGSSTKQVTVSNTGTAAITISSVSLSGTNRSEFSQTNNCSTIASGASCVASVIFSPTSAGAKNAALVIVSNDPETPSINLPLGGTGVILQ